MNRKKKENLEQRREEGKKEVLEIVSGKDAPSNGASMWSVHEMNKCGCVLSYLALYPRTKHSTLLNLNVQRSALSISTQEVAAISSLLLCIPPL